MSSYRLSREEEADLVARAKAGDRGAMPDLWERYKGLAWAVARKRKSPGVDPDDLAQEGYLGIARAVELFDPSKGVRFATYAWLWVRKRIDSYIARQGKPLPQGGDDEMSEVLDPSTGDDGPDASSRADDAAKVCELLRQLPRRDRLALELYYGIQTGEPLPLSEVGQFIGVKAQRAGRIVAEAKQRLRELAGVQEDAGEAELPDAQQAA